MRQYYYTPVSNELYHHGILGMKWGVRRYQNADGSLTDAGKKRYGEKSGNKKTGLSPRTKRNIKRGVKAAASILGAALTINALMKNESYTQWQAKGKRYCDMHSKKSVLNADGTYKSPSDSAWS